MGATNRGRTTGGALDLVAIGDSVGIVFKETFLAERNLADARRRLIERGQLLLKPTLCLGVLRQLTYRKRCGREDRLALR